MKKENLINLFKSPEIITEKDLSDLQEIIKEYPYFQAAHFLFLYASHRANSSGFEQNINKSAIYLSNRAALFEAIQLGWGKSFHTEQSKSKKEVIKNTPVSPIEIDPITVDLEVPVAEITPKESNSDKLETSAVETATTGKSEDLTPFVLEETAPVEINDKTKDEITVKSTTSNELLELDTQEEVDEEEVAGKENEEIKQEEQNPFLGDLIESFLKNPPRMVPRLDLNDTRGDISTDSVVDSEGIYTETMAVIYEQQGLYQKSIEIYNKLILKYPEKSAYFATRIKELENLIK